MGNRLLEFFTLSSLALLVVAEKDSTYWPPGTNNPNVGRKMYWQDSRNVLQDLKKFHRLYVRYHNCAFSPFGTPSNAREDLFNNSYWYLGLTQPYRANAAFSLYGILKGKRDQGCNKATFINSFFTTYGAQTFVEALQLSGGFSGSSYDIFGQTDFSSVCTRNLVNDTKDTIPGKGQIKYSNSVSYTLACDASQRFEIDSYSGASCDQRKTNGTYKTLDEENEQLEGVTCSLIYDSGNSEKYVYEAYIPYDEGSYNKDESSTGIVPNITHPLDLLKFSKSCSTMLYPESCPDPYGITSMYQQKINQMAASHMAYYKAMTTKTNNASWVVMLSLGLLMTAMSYGVDASLRRKIQRARAARKSGSFDDASSITDDSIVNRGAFVDSVLCGHSIDFAKSTESAGCADGAWAERPKYISNLILSRVGTILFGERQESESNTTSPTPEGLVRHQGQPRFQRPLKAPIKLFRTASAPPALAQKSLAQKSPAAIDQIEPCDDSEAELNIAQQLSGAMEEMVATVKDILADTFEGNDFELMNAGGQSAPNKTAEGNLPSSESASHSGSDNSNASGDGLLKPKEPTKKNGLLKRILSHKNNGGWS